MTSKFSELCRIISGQNVFQKKFIAASLKDCDDERLREAESYINFCLHNGQTLERLAEAYLYVVNMTQEEQLFFAREGRYRYSKLSDVDRLVYSDPAVMGQYMAGLGLSIFLWPQHHAVHALFKRIMPRDRRSKSYLEIGPGHGLFFVHSLKYGGYGEYVGLDISATSLEKTKSLIAYHFAEPVAGIRFINSDFLACDFNKRYDTIVMGEILEHVEQPSLFINKISQAVAPGGLVFISTCLNAPEVDHIYNFENFDEIKDMFADAGLAVKEEYPIPYTGKTVEQCLERKLPLNVALSVDFAELSCPETTRRKIRESAAAL